ncbi:MAG: enoyl-CoA hydratase/isomerase family protein [Proteobacteria bacterium]|nr:enoyl-CoA hydratase/isomerase family protein [Pseudomonadota bacterium]
MSEAMVLAERNGAVLVLTLNRPERLNAAPPALFEQLAAYLDNLGDARAVLITGGERAFCSGADLAGKMMAPGSAGDNAYAALTGTYNPTMEKLADLPVPIVSAVNGPAAGIGCSLALAADFCVMGESAYLLQAFVNIGLVPDGGSSWMLPRLAGKARATEMMLLGERIHGPKAESWGLVYKCLPDAVVQDEALALAQRLAEGPSMALGLMRRGIMASLQSDYAEGLAREAADQREAGNSADAAEGTIAFIQKRKAEFKGQ